MANETSSSRVKSTLITFVVGVVAGVVGTIVLPGLVRPYLPEAIVGTEALVHGIVTGKRVEVDRVLLTLPTEDGTLLATFTEDMGEIDLMIQVGDSVVLEVDEYQPFIENPRLSRVVTLSSPLDARPPAMRGGEPVRDSTAQSDARADSAEKTLDGSLVRSDTSGV